MKHTFTHTLVALMATALVACESVPEVENKLQSMQFHSNMYVVQAGETVQSIAFRYRMDEEELKSLNPGLENTIAAGLRINVRPGTQLSQTVRSRASYAPARQPALVTEKQARTPRAVTQNTSQRVIVAPASAKVVVPANRIVVQPKEEIIETVVIAGPPITEIPASSRIASTDSERLVTPGNFLEEPEILYSEEIIEDTLDYQPITAADGAVSETEPYLGEWSWPTAGPVAREYAPHEAGGQGVDIAGTPGQDVRAAMSGTVVYSGRDLSGGGNLIIVRHDDDLMTTYSHTDNLYVAEEDYVLAGDPIASLGWNERNESVLRFEVRRDGNPLNPMKFLPVQ